MVDSAVTSAQQIKGPRHLRPDPNNPGREKPHHHPENDDWPFKQPDDPKGIRSDILKGPPPPGLMTQTTPHRPKTAQPTPPTPSEPLDTAPDPGNMTPGPLL
ncbi:hypothetical protein E4T56_gene4638 [Termitomyces sp. T112]|nr:hypothetical protein E4T56_gene4638 [Termitomyces sp. T112]